MDYSVQFVMLCWSAYDPEAAWNEVAAIDNRLFLNDKNELGQETSLVLSQFKLCNCSIFCYNLSIFIILYAYPSWIEFSLT